MENTTNKKKEGLILALVAVIGLAGLLLLQFARKSQTAGADAKTVVQNQNNTAGSVEAGQPKIQKVPGNLLHEQQQPEMNVPFVYELIDFSPGGIYQLDPGDGGQHQTFQNGKLTYTYRKPGIFFATVYAIDQGQQYKIITSRKQVANITVQKAVNKKTGKPAVDY
jgi:hypothetical protein